MMLTKFIKNKNGFTLVELMLVVGIMGILAGVLIPQLTGLQNRAKDTGIISAAGSIRTALRVYYTEKGHYPGPGDFSSGDDWADLNQILYAVELEDKNNFNIADINFIDNSGEENSKYLIELISANEEGTVYYLGEKSFNENRAEASEL